MQKDLSQDHKDEDRSSLEPAKQLQQLCCLDTVHRFKSLS